LVPRFVFILSLSFVQFVLFNTIGIVTLLLVIFFKHDEDYLANASMYIISTVCFSFCVVFYNAYIPLLVKSMPEMKAAIETETSKQDKDAQKKVKDMEDELTSSLSLQGLACGFSGQFLFLCGIFVVILVSPTTNNYSIRLAVFLSGIWVLVFSTITFLLLEKRPGPPLPDNDTYWQHSLNQARGTFINFKYLPELGKFMLSYFVFSDGTSTLANAAIVFAQVELNFTFVQIGITLLLVSASAVFGCWAWWKIQVYTKISQKHVLMLNLALMAIIPVWARGIKSDIEFFLVVVLYGLNTGSQQAFTRTIYSTLIPYGRESEYFSFYEVSDKGRETFAPQREMDLDFLSM
jgi:UMF1 family MFS transporter